MKALLTAWVDRWWTWKYKRKYGYEAKPCFAAWEGFFTVFTTPFPFRGKECSQKGCYTPWKAWKLLRGIKHDPDVVASALYFRPWYWKRGKLIVHCWKAGNQLHLGKVSPSWKELLDLNQERL